RKLLVSAGTVHDLMRVLAPRHVPARVIRWVRPSLASSQVKLAARNLARHRTRTLISVSAIAFGVVALLIAGGFVEWIFWAMRESTVETGLGHVHVSRPGFRDAGLADPSAYLLPSDPKYLAAARSAPGVQ